MAITKIAPKSSAMASAAKKIFNEAGSFFPNNEIMASENAMSVAIGIAQPLENSVLKFKLVKIIAGINIPPIAAIIGNDALLKLESSPSKSSRLISKPTKRKKIAINPSLIQTEIGYCKCRFSEPILVSKIFWNEIPKGEFAMKSERITQKIKRIPEDWLL